MPQTAIANQAYDLLYHKIVACRYMPGEPLNEKFLLEETGMGRTPVREALLRLQKEGLIEIFPRKGMRVSPFTKKNISDLYQARKLLEPTVMTSYLSLYAKSTLLDYQVRFENSLNDDPLTHFELDAQFHTYLISITQNDILMDMYHTLMVQQIRLAMYADLKTPEDRPESLAQHRAIIDALLRENEAYTRDSVILHLNHSLVSSLSAIQNI